MPSHTPSLVTPSLRSRRLPLATLLAALLAIFAAGNAPAVNIIVSYDETDRPSFDPNGEKLMTMMAWVEAYYESLLPHVVPPGGFVPTFDIEVWWEDLGGTKLAETQINPFEVDIVFDTKLGGVERSWFFDETPVDNSEFTFSDTLGTSSSIRGNGQNLFRDLTSDQQSSGYNGSPHGVLEVGYQAFARSGGPADGMFDLWSTALHEMGHVMAFQPELIDDDNDYEFYKPQHGGVYAAMNEDPDSDGHVAPKTALMCDGCGQESLRRLPSAADLLSMAYQIGPISPSLPRMDYLGNHSNSWDDTLNWIGGRVPGTFTEVFIRNGTPAMIGSGSHTARNMFVYENSSVAIQGSSSLKVFHELRVGNISNGTRGEVHVGNIVGNPSLEVESLNIDNGLVNLNSQNAVLLMHRGGNIRDGASLMGAGAVETQGQLNNDGEISAGMFLLFGFGGELTLNAIDNGTLDLDGGAELVFEPGLAAFTLPGGFPGTFPGQLNDEFGRISAVNGNLRVISRLADSFDGTATIGAGRTMTFRQPWGFGGNLVMRGGTLAGAKVNFGGTTNAESGVSTIAAPLSTGLFTRINVRNGAQLNFTPEYLGSSTGAQDFGGSFNVETVGVLHVDVPGTSWNLKRSLTMAAGSRVQGDDIINLGRIQGAGELAVAGVANSGVVAPAFDLRIPGLFNQSSTGRLEIDLAGLVQGAGYDVLRAGTAQLAGTLAITLADGFLPAVGTRFDLLTAGFVSGAFNGFELNVPDDVRFNGHLNYETGKVSFHVTQARFTADFDGDGDVDAGDMGAWASAFQGAPAFLGAGDADGDGDADGADMLMIQRQMGRRIATLPTRPHVGGGIGGGGVFQNVPEPAPAAFALPLLAAAACWRRKPPAI